MRTDLPTMDDHSRPYWDGYREGRFLIARCGDCERVHHYPRPGCPFCWSENVAPVEASGNATLYTYSIIHMNDLPPFKDRLPYVAAVVDLEEGPRVMTTIVDCDPADLRIGMALTADFREADDDLTIAVFRPAA